MSIQLHHYFRIRCVPLLVAGALQLSAAALVDLAPGAHLTIWAGAQKRAVKTLQPGSTASAIELEWDEERDIEQLQIVFGTAGVHAKSIEYWFKNWPYEPPRMPSMEDPMDDPWQGEWLKAESREQCEGQTCRYKFQPLRTQENRRARFLPGSVYRRTLKIRFTFDNPETQLTSLRAFSSSAEEEHQVSVQLAQHQKAGSEVTGWFSVYNGRLVSIRPQGFTQGDRYSENDGHYAYSVGRGNKSIALDLIAAKPVLPGSNDETVVTVHAASTANAKDLSFSFKIADLASGPIVIPVLGARVADTHSSAPNQPHGKTIRSRIALEPEQTYQRASAEIPALDPKQREWGGPLYMPLAADSSWQKFALQLGGDVFLSKEGLKAKPEELKRLRWPSDRLTWAIGTGPRAEHPYDQQPKLVLAEGYLPIAQQSWSHDNLSWKQEAFATVLRGPLAPGDAGRNEQTPAVLLMRITVKNIGVASQNATFWMIPDADQTLHITGTRLLSGKTLRAVFDGPHAVLGEVPQTPQPALKFSFELKPGEEKDVILKLPAVTDLSEQDMRDIDALNYPAQRNLVAAYWKTLIGKAARFSVPEPVFNTFLRSTIAHIHLTATKDPKTGLVMLPAASYIYDVYENESCYQLLLLDALGQGQDAATLLKPMLTLQGSKNFPGAHAGSFAGVFHGVKISDDLDYTANGYGLDQGTVLWTLAQHYLYTRDREWFRMAWPHMKRAIEWIERQRATTRAMANGEPVREYGLLPASKLEDNNDWAHWFSINAFAWASMDLTGRILSELHQPEANEIALQAAAYRNDLRKAVLRATVQAPVARLQDGTYEPYVPTVPWRRFRLFGPAQMNYYARYGNPELKPLLRLGADRDTLCGTVLLLILGVFEPHEPLADWILNDWEDNETLSSGMGMNIHGMTEDARWFSQGGMVFQANLINPIPVYLKRHEIPAAIRNLYNDFVGCFYPGASQFTEEFHEWSHGSGPFYKSPDEARFVNRLRDTLLLEDGDTLWLAPGTPRRWLASREGVQVKDAQTFFGPVSYTLRAGATPHTVEALVHLPERNPPQHSWLVVRTPSRKIKKVTLNGKSWKRVDHNTEAIDLSGIEGALSIQVAY